MSKAGTEHSATDMVFGRLDPFSLKDATNNGDMPLVEGIAVQNTELRLRNRVRQAVEKKEEHEPLQQEYIFRIAHERLGRQRKRIEAMAIGDFQQAPGQRFLGSDCRH